MKRRLTVSIGPAVAVSVWVNQRLVPPEQYRVDEAAGTVTFLSPPAGPLAIGAVHQPPERAKRRQAQWKRELKR